MHAHGYRGAEGTRHDDWVLVDCYDSVVHLMIPIARRAFNLEDFWAEGKPKSMGLPLNLAPKEYDAAFEKFLEENPVPEDYYNHVMSGNHDDSWDKPSKSKKGKGASSNKIPSDFHKL